MLDVHVEDVTHHDGRVVFVLCFLTRQPVWAARVVLLCAADHCGCSWLLPVWSVMQLQPKGLSHTQGIQQAAHECTVCHS